MTLKEITELRRSADEIAWRDSWYTHVMTETGERCPAKIARSRARLTGRPLTRWLHKLRRLRSATGLPR
jgi:hypothetical protein